ncbi:hypothetical protein [Desulfotomaculum copahuensis]|uniref:hypothetical protein n=1 Tax=Desulfotomaculum copahuensis TaxID=1838280 RepID=UPI001248DC76|nr:hypothetical protein [Desulfotomaculum copahuensis]
MASFRITYPASFALDKLPAFSLAAEDFSHLASLFSFQGPFAALFRGTFLIVSLFAASCQEPLSGFTVHRQPCFMLTLLPPFVKDFFFPFSPGQPPAAATFLIYHNSMSAVKRQFSPFFPSYFHRSIKAAVLTNLACHLKFCQ